MYTEYFFVWKEKKWLSLFYEQRLDFQLHSFQLYLFHAYVIYVSICFIYINLSPPPPPGQNGRHFPDDIFQHIFLNELVRILIENSLKFVFVPKGSIDNYADPIHWRIYMSLGGRWVK